MKFLKGIEKGLKKIAHVPREVSRTVRKPLGMGPGSEFSKCWKKSCQPLERGVKGAAHKVRDTIRIFTIPMGLSSIKIKSTVEESFEVNSEWEALKNEEKTLLLSLCDNDVEIFWSAIFDTCEKFGKSVSTIDGASKAIAGDNELMKHFILVVKKLIVERSVENET